MEEGNSPTAESCLGMVRDTSSSVTQIFAHVGRVSRLNRFTPSAVSPPELGGASKGVLLGVQGSGASSRHWM